MTTERDRERVRPESGPVAGLPDAVHEGQFVRATWPGTVSAAHLGPSAAELERLQRVARGHEEADLIVRGGTVVVVHTGDLLRRDLLIVGRFIAAVTRPGALSGRRALDASGRFLLPAYVDGYIRVERTLLTPGELARLVVPRGTATMLADPAQLVALCGARGVRLVTATRTPVRLLAGATRTTAAPPAPGPPGVPDPSTPPGSPPPGSPPPGSPPGGPAVDPAMRVPRQAVPLPGSVDVSLPGIIAGIGPAGVMSGGGLAGSVRPRVGRTADDDLWDALVGSSDERVVTDLALHGHLDRDVRRVVDAGMDPTTAIRMATLDPARRHGLDHLLGSLAPARLADVQIVSNLTGSVPPEIVLVNGRMAAERGRPLFDNTDTAPDWSYERVTLPTGLYGGSFAVPASSVGRAVNGVQVSVSPGGTPRVEAVQVQPVIIEGAGHAVTDPAHDLLKIAIVLRGAGRADRMDRMDRAGISVGFIRGVGLRQGAIAMTTNVAPGDLAIIGAGDHDMMTAARALEGMGGGFVVVDRGWVLAACPLPIAGVMSDAPWEAVRDQLAGVDSAAASLGCRLPSPFLTLAPLGRRLCRGLS